MLSDTKDILFGASLLSIKDSFEVFLKSYDRAIHVAQTENIDSPLSLEFGKTIANELEQRFLSAILTHASLYELVENTFTQAKEKKTNGLALDTSKDI